jgi:hypothetical protein
MRPGASILRRLPIVAAWLLFLGIGVLWCRSWWTSDILQWSDANPGPDTEDAGEDIGLATSKLSISAERGEVTLYRIRGGQVLAFPGFAHLTLRASGRQALAIYVPLYLSLGKTLDPGFSSSGRIDVIRVKYWFLMLLAGIVPGWTVFRWQRRRQRRRNGRCVECGYDLRATADRCPECNTPIPPT